MQRLLAAILVVTFACGETSSHAPAGASPPDEEVTPPIRLVEGGRMGPLANAGPDQRVLPGMVVRLDGRSTLSPEDARPITLRWVQESGPGVDLGDPTSVVTDFVAPPLRPGSSDRLVFRLIADDGFLSSRDRVVVEMVEDPALLAFAPVAVAGGDLEAAYGSLVEIEPPTFLDPACLDEAEPEACLQEPLPFCWTQIQGTKVELSGACGEMPTSFQAPNHDALLIFRLDAHGRGASASPASCGPELERQEKTPLCATPDILRVVVRKEPRRGEVPPITSWKWNNDDQDRVGIVVVSEKFLEIPGQLDITAGARDEGERWSLVSFFRPILGRIDGPLGGNKVSLPTPPWPSPVALAFEPLFYTHHTQGGRSRIEWFHGAPPLALIAWRAPADLPPLVADAGALPCGATGDDAGDCRPFLPGEEVSLEGSALGHPSPQNLKTCWEQTFGPKVELQPGGGCLEDKGTRRFVAPAPQGSAPLELAFQFSIQDAGPFSSRPSTLWVQVRPDGVEPPLIQLETPGALAPGASGLLDASASSDPEGSPLRFRWRQLAGEPVAIQGCAGPLEASTSCVRITTSLEARGSLRMELQVASAVSELVTRREFEIPFEEQGEIPP